MNGLSHVQYRFCSLARLAHVSDWLVARSQIPEAVSTIFADEKGGRRRTRKPRKQSSQDALPAPASLPRLAPAPEFARPRRAVSLDRSVPSDQHQRQSDQLVLKPHYHITPRDPARPPRRSRTPRTESPRTAPLSVKTAPAPDTAAARRRRVLVITHSRRSPDIVHGAAGGIS